MIVRSDRSVPASRASYSLVHPRQPADPPMGNAHGQYETRARLRVRWPRPGVVIVSIEGVLDLAALPRLTELIRQRLRAVSLETAVLDFSAVAYTSSVALELLEAARRRCSQRGGELLVVTGNGPIDRLLEITGCGAMFRLYPDVPTALTHTRS
ncbi:hypothetical protein GCM10009854_21720 [Saccharopolyspora halophila]|uniref:STAS domain-containing protein n=1 Tax=Saccharopolyspora halophila TaxID=405551 RepID=A0ABP5T376_9PSEU